MDPAAPANSLSWAHLPGTSALQQYSALLAQQQGAHSLQQYSSPQLQYNSQLQYSGATFPGGKAMSEGPAAGGSSGAAAVSEFLLPGPERTSLKRPSSSQGVGPQGSSLKKQAQERC